MKHSCATVSVASALACCALGAAPGPARADALALVAAAPVGRVAPAGAGVAVLRDGVVWLLDDEGRAGARCPRARLARRRAHRPDRTALAAGEVLADVGMSDEDETPEAEELLDDEGAPAAPRRRGAGEPPPARALDLAGTPGGVWIGADDGVWWLDAGTARCARAGLAGRHVGLVAAGGTLVVAVSGAAVWRARDGGAFEIAAVLPSRARAAAVADDGAILVADDDGVAWIGAAGAPRRALEGQVEALVACGAVVHALAHDGVYRLNGADVERLGAPPPARALACTWPGLLAAGAGLWASPDGAAWSEDGAGLGRAFSGVARAAGQTWLLTDEGLFVVVPAADDWLFEDGAPRRPRRRVGPAPLWAALRPRLGVVFDEWTESGRRAGWRLWLSLTLSLERGALVRLGPVGDGER